MSNNVHIRPLTEDDAQLSVEWRNDPSIWTYTKSRPNRQITLADELNWVRQATSDPASYRCAIIVNDKYVGNIYLTDIDQNKAQFHIFIGNHDFEGIGVAQKATRSMLSYAYSQLNLKSIYLEVHEGNAQAIHIYEKMGFQATSHTEQFITMELELSKELNETTR